MHFKFDSNLLKFGKFLITIPTLQMPEKTIGIEATVSHAPCATVRPSPARQQAYSGSQVCMHGTRTHQFG